VNESWDKQVLTIPPNLPAVISVLVYHHHKHSSPSASPDRSSSSLLHILHSPRLPRELVRQEQPPRVFVAFPDTLSPACVFRSRPAALAGASLTLSWNKHLFTHFLTSASL
jgi:hypothetical protein